MKNNLFFLLAILSLLISCTNKIEEVQSKLGSINWEVDTNQEAKAHFEKGLLLLHSFEYPDARNEFIQSQNADTSFLLSYWGEAMTWNHPIWNTQYTAEGNEVLAKLGKDRATRLALAKKDLDRDLLESMEIIFAEGEKYDKDLAYTEHMKVLRKKYPENHEIASFYALSLLGASHDGRDEVLYERGAKIAEGIIAENPNHPGALHYLIHSYDDPAHAHLALQAANSYANVAPDASHALHMPSHIYVALGMWDEVISSNIASWKASADRAEAKELDNDALGYHALQWLVYGYLQKNDFAKARALTENMWTYAQEDSSARARTHWVMIRGAFVAETGLWDDPLNDLDFEYDDLNISIQAMNSFSQGMQYALSEDRSGLESTLKQMKESYAEAAKTSLVSGAQMCSGVGWNEQKASQQNLNDSKVMQLELEATLEILRGNPQQANLLLKEASDLELSTSYAFGPPKIAKPSTEMYAEFLASRNNLEEAAEYFNLVLERAPNRRIAVEGLSAINPQGAD